jgi:Fungal specific transcription factor domain
MSRSFNHTYAYLAFIFSDCIYHFCEGHDATQHAAFGEAAHIAVTLRMHEESAYEGLDPIECEVRRRIFWLLFGGSLVWIWSIL